MRGLIEVSFLVLLLWLGWKQPFVDQVRGASLVPSLEPSRLARLAEQAQNVPRPAATNGGTTAAAPAPAPDRSWLWDTTKLDPAKGHH